MKEQTVGTPLYNTQVYHLDNNLFNVFIPFSDGSNLTFLIRFEDYEIYPCTAAGRFISKSLGTDFRHRIRELCQRTISAK